MAIDGDDRKKIKMATASCTCTLDIVDYLFVLNSSVLDEKKMHFRQILFLYKNHHWILDKELIELSFAKAIHILTKKTLIILAVILIMKVSVNYAHYRLGVVGQMTNLVCDWLFYAYLLFMTITYLGYKLLGPEQLRKKYNWHQN
ncbi:hypothetical protein KEM09_20415 [Carboxylicivirga mesophila]|uniref:Uncharacterized protein n=1 Tax=Carboxylicivirga mesophila TaxID=1166478 RepID=A0ABS5KFU1_9BACT|nr:hypothetical protein [Carboxylicivirga mesophila]MBS2213784.1 hypothetical protein [Carboxylicivirga mesophila]